MFGIFLEKVYFFLLYLEIYVCNVSLFMKYLLVYVYEIFVGLCKINM